MKLSQRHFVATSRNRAKKSIKAVIGLLNFHLKVSQSFKTLYPEEMKTVNGIQRQLDDLLKEWEPLAPGMRSE